MHAEAGRASELGPRSGKSRRCGHDDGNIVPPAPETVEDLCKALGQTISRLVARQIDTRTATSLAYVANVLFRGLEVSALEKRMGGCTCFLEREQPAVAFEIELEIATQQSLALGLQQQYKATAIYNDGTWTSSDVGFAVINASGLASSAGTGTAMITATWNGVSGNTQLTVH